MPAATLEPPSAPPSSVGSAVPSGRGEINVGSDGSIGGAPAAPRTPATPKPAKPAEAAKPAVHVPTAREKMQQSLIDKIKPGTRVDAAPETPTPDATTGAEDADAAEEPAEAAEAPETPEAPTEPAKAGEAAPKGKVNPWKLLDEHKTARANAEKEIAELKKLVPNAELRKQEIAEIEQIKTRNKELEDEIRYVNYQKSPEFKDKYQVPYEKAWSKAMNELKEITVQDADGRERPVAPQDMLDLVNAPLGKARELANTMFGDFADDVMAHRKEIKNLFEAQATALEEARTKGAEREQKQAEESKTRHEAMIGQINETWKKAIESSSKDEQNGKFFTPVEGDQEGNLRLSKGYEIVDRAMSEFRKISDPSLSREDRAKMIERQVAVRNRAAAYGRMKHIITQREARIAELEKELAQFKGSTPETTTGQPAKEGGPALSAHDQMISDLIKRAKPQ